MQAINYPVTTLAPPVVESELPGPAESPPPTRDNRLLRRIAGLGGAVLALVLVGFLLGRLVAEPTDSDGHPVGLEGFAESYLSTLLTRAGEGAEDELVRFLGYSPALTGLQPGAWYVRHTSVWSIEEVGPDRWVVLVGADQLGLQDGGYRPAGTSFYTVEVELTPIGFRATSFPTAVAAPPMPDPPAPQEPLADSQLADAVTRFLSTRFSGTETAPFESVTLLAIFAHATGGDHLDVEVDFLGFDATGHATPLTQRLTVSEIDWSVTETRDSAVSRGSN